MTKKMDKKKGIFCTYIDLPYSQVIALKKILNSENPDKVKINYIEVIWEEK